MTQKKNRKLMLDAHFALGTAEQKLGALIRAEVASLDAVENADSIARMRKSNPKPNKPWKIPAKMSPKVREDLYERMSTLLLLYHLADELRSVDMGLGIAGDD